MNKYDIRIVTSIRELKDPYPLETGMGMTPFALDLNTDTECVLIRPPRRERFSFFARLAVTVVAQKADLAPTRNSQHTYLLLFPKVEYSIVKMTLIILATPYNYR